MSLPRIQQTLLERCLARRWQIGQRAFASKATSPTAKADSSTTPSNTKTSSTKTLSTKAPAPAPKVQPVKTAGTASTPASKARSAKAPAATTTGTTRVNTNDVRSTTKKPPGLVGTSVERPARLPSRPPQPLSPAAAAEAEKAAARREELLRAARLKRNAEQRAASELRLDEAAAEANKKKKQYDKRYRSWWMTVTALPILLVTSYELYARLVLGREQKKFSETPKKTEEAESQGPESGGWPGATEGRGN